MGERVVDVDLANERVILATMIHDPERRRQLALRLRSDDFGDPRHQVMFRALSGLSRASLTWSEDTFAEFAKGEDFGSWKYLREIVDKYEANTNLDYHIDRLRLDRVKLELIRDDLQDLSRACEDPSAPPERIRSVLKSALTRIDRMGHKFTSGGDLLVDGYYETLKMRAIVGDVVEGTGFEILDSVLARGFVPGTLSVIAARPGFGKTTFLANFIRHRVHNKKGIYVCGWEMLPEDYLDMMISAETGIPENDLVRRVKSFSKEQNRAIIEAAELYRNRNLIEFEANPFPHLEKTPKKWDTNDRNLDFFESSVQRASRTKTVVALDVVGKMFSDRRPDSVTEALVRIRGMAQAYGVHIMLLHHINRAGAEGRPALEHIKNSGAFEEEADLIFGLDRPRLRAGIEKRSKMKDTLDIHVLKQRKGPAPACVRYTFDGTRYALSNEVEVDLSMLETNDEEDWDM